MANEPTPKQSFTRRCSNAAIALAAGASGMLAQLIWARILIQWFGTSSLTIATALGASLAGLALGAFIFRGSSTAGFRWLGRPAQRPGWLLLLAGVGVMEGVILFHFGNSVLPFMTSMLPANAALVITAVVVLLPVNIALGGVLPTLIWSTESEATKTNTTKTVGALYAAETLGGAAGALLAGFWMIQRVGLAGTLLVTSLITIAIGAIAVFRFKSDQPDQAALIAGKGTTGETASEALTAGIGFITLTAIFLAGVASLSMEIIWQRALILMVGTDTHSYMIVAVSYLIGVATGSYLCGQFLPQRRHNLFSYLQLGIAFTSLIAMALFCGLVSVAGQKWLMGATSGLEVVGNRFLASFGLLILPSCLAGATFPAAVSLLVRSGYVNADATGRTYATIAVGNIAGVIIVGFWLIPIAGLQSSLLVLAGVAVAAAALATIHWNLSFWFAGLAVFGAGGYLIATQQPIGLTDLSPNQHVAFYREGPVATVSVVAENDDDSVEVASRRMVVDGIVIGENIGGVDEKQKMLAHLPLLIHAMSNADSSPTLNAISIGLGTGILAGELAIQPSVKHITCVELSPAVITASDFFKEDNHDLASLSNATILQGDGIHFLRRSNETYDCIVSDGKSRPGHAGNVGFFSSEYYRLAVQRLSTTGTFVQWVSLDGSPREVQTILKTFASEFAYSYAAIAPPDSIYLVGRKAPIHWNEMACDAYLSNAKSLAPYGWRTPDDIRSMAWLDTREIAASLLEEIAANSLNRPVLERFALDIHRPDAHQHKIQNLTFLESCLSDKLGSVSMFEGEPSENAVEIRDACSILVQAAKHIANPINIDLASAAGLHQQALRTFPRLSRGIHLADRLLEQGKQLSESGEPISASELAKLLQLTASMVPSDAELQLRIGNALITQKQFSHAAGCFHRVTRLQPDNAQAHVSFARCVIELGKPRAAMRPLTAALRLQPDHEQAKQLLDRITQGGAPFR